MQGEMDVQLHSFISSAQMEVDDFTTRSFDLTKEHPVIIK
jgi:hypothetical protein